MPKLTLTDVSNILGNPVSAANTININNQLIEDAVERLLSRDGTTPNQMEADLDMNHYDILNARSVYADNIYVDGIPLDTAVEWKVGSGAPSPALGENGDMYLDKDTGDVYGPKATVGGWVGPVANIKGPVGPEGPEGPQGPQGLQGIQGVQGIQGPQGVQGTAGPKGDSFDPDAVGLATDRSLYDNEAAGFSFLDTENGYLYFKKSAAAGDWTSGVPFTAGPQGPVGPQGIQGIQGPQGIEGPQGPQGPAGVGVPNGGTTNQALLKASATDQDTVWADIKRPVDHKNFFIGTFFQSNENTLVDLYSTIDLKFLSRINNTRISSGPKRLMFGRDPSFMFDNDTFYIPVTLAGMLDGVDQGPDPAHKDVMIYRSKDLITFDPVNITAGPVQVRGPNPFDGGSVPAWHVWCSGLWDLDGDIWLQFMVSYYPDFVDINGATVLGMQTYFARALDMDTLSFDTPVKFVLGTPGTDFYLDPKVYLIDGEYWIFPKNEYSKIIEVWKSPVWDPTGASFVKQYDMTFPVDIEGCSIVREYLSSDELGSGTYTTKYHLHADGYEDGMYYTASTNNVSAFANWSAPVPVTSTAAIRGGAVINLADSRDPKRAIAIAQEAMAYYDAATEEAVRVKVLPAGVQNLVPQDNVLYITNGTTFANVTIPRVSARRFYMAAFTGAPDGGIQLNPSSALPMDAQLNIGFKKMAGRIVEFRLRPDAAEYYPVGVGTNVLAAKATKNNVDQVVATGSPTKVTFGTTVLNTGSLWDAANSRLTNFSGQVRVNVKIGIDSGLNTGADYYIRIRKNGTNVETVAFAPSKTTGSWTAALDRVVPVVGTDVIEIFFEHYAPGSVTIMGEADMTSIEVTAL